MSDTKIEIRPAKGSVQKRKRKARGQASGIGGESGRGRKGSKSRSGFKSKPGFEGGQTPLYRRIPKKRGTGMARIFKIAYQAVNLDDLQVNFNEGDIVSLDTLIQKGLIHKNDRVKILGRGELTKKLIVEAHKCSKSALEKIESVKGTYRVINNAN